MSELTAVIGRVYWCDTSQSNLGDEFSDKESRPVLLIASFGNYAAVYPCSSVRFSIGGTDWIGDLYGTGDSYVVHNRGLYYVPESRLQLPGVQWKDWELFEKSHSSVIHADLRRFKHQHRKRFEQTLEPQAAQQDKQTFRLADAFTPEMLEQLTARTPQPPPPPVPHIKVVKVKKPVDEFQQAVDAIMPYHILKKSDGTGE